MSQGLAQLGQGTDTDIEREAVERCAAVTAKSRSNFYFAFLPLPKERREAIFCVYAFCRRIDDIVDEEPEPGQEPRLQLERWRRRVRQIHEGSLPPSENALALGLDLTHQHYGLRQDDLLAVIDGMEMDLEPRRYETHADLGLYCRRVAGHVGCLCLPIFGATLPESREFAIKLGHAFQLTNILRDVHADAKLGRIYLPQEDMERFGVSAEELLAGHRSARMSALLEHEREHAASLFREASRALPSAERSKLYSASIMSAIYRRLLQQMSDRRDEGWERRPSLPSHLKILLALGVLLRDRLLHLA